MPSFVHDCETCYFLGTYNAHDLYYCPKPNGLDSYLARYGDEPHEYTSSPHIPGFVTARLVEIAQHEACSDVWMILRVAFLLAQDMGLHEPKIRKGILNGSHRRPRTGSS